MTNAFYTRLQQPVDSAALACFRIFFGLVACWDLLWHLHSGAVEQIWARPKLHFTYYGFGWVQPWFGDHIHLLFWVLAVLALGIALGFLYRICAPLFFLGFTYTFLMERAAFQNHFYLLCLLAFLLIFMPLHQTWSVDARLGWTRPSTTIPVWCLWLLRLQLGIVYFYGGLAKLNTDWLQGEPMRLWLSAYGDYFLIGPYVQQDWLAYFFSWGGLLLDLLVVPGLLWHRSRLWAYGISLSFHLTNSWIFTIGIFPWFMIGATTLFFAPDWPRRLWCRIGGGSVVAPPTPTSSAPRWMLHLLAVYTAVQLLLPFTHLLYTGNTSWTEQGQRFAWRMMLRDKQGRHQIHLRDPASGVHWRAKLEKYLAPWQIRAGLNDPDMLLQFAHHLARLNKQEGLGHIEIYADAQISLNGRKPQFMVDPKVNLAAQPRSLAPYPWIVPLHRPLKGP
ncbi:MAG: vitamin K-dependent gamma-carboxylase [Candidatus Latescibacteria bacterium]|nr:vitamin K-dependent gamma-carboxylase [Candidatus Latescibacterota bacterium]